nr:hypothetical protein [uncultured Vibrio sp.]
MAKVLLAQATGAGYNGTHGNLSVLHAAVPALADGDSVIGFKLEAGIKLVELKILCGGAAVANLTATAMLSEVDMGDGVKVETTLGAKISDVVPDATAVPAGVLTSDQAGYAPKGEDTQKEKFVVVTFAGAAVPKGKLTLAAYTTSEGTI